MKARFIEPMLLERAEKLSQGPSWTYELKLDGFRVIAFKTGGRIHLRSRNDKDFNARYPAIVEALAAMPDETVIDGEIVALDHSGRPSFNALQNYETATLIYYVFDVMVLAGKDVMNEPLSVRQLLQVNAATPTAFHPLPSWAPDEIECRVVLRLPYTKPSPTLATALRHTMTAERQNRSGSPAQSQCPRRSTDRPSWQQRQPYGHTISCIDRKAIKGIRCLVHHIAIVKRAFPRRCAKP
jgi:ATP dependent DNA ligase domain